MKIKFILIVCLLAVPLLAKEIIINKIPVDVESFIELRAEISGTPEGGAALVTLALVTLVEDYELGLKFFTIALTRNNIQKGSAYKGFAPMNALNYHFQRFKDPRRKRTPWSYFKGTGPENNYTTEAPFKMTFTRNKYSVKPNGEIKVFIACSGAASPRPVTLAKNSKGIWKAKEISSLFLDVQAPVKKDDGDDL